MMAYKEIREILQENINTFINLFSMILSSFSDVFEKSTAFLNDCSETENIMSFFLIFLINSMYLSLQCFLFGGRAQKSFYSHFSLKLRGGMSICLEAKMRKNSRSWKTPEYLGDLCACKAESFFKKEPQMKLLGSGTKGHSCKFPWPFPRLLNYGYEAWEESENIDQAASQTLAIIR